MLDSYLEVPQNLKAFYMCNRLMHGQYAILGYKKNSPYGGAWMKLAELQFILKSPRKHSRTQTAL